MIITRPKSVVYIHIVLLLLLLFLVHFTQWLLENNAEIFDRTGSIKLGVTVLLVLMPLMFVKIVWDIYLTYKSVPLITIADNGLVLNRVFLKDVEIPYSKIQKISLKGNKFATNVTVHIKKTPFRNITKRVYEVFVTKEAMSCLTDKNVKITKVIKPVIYFSRR